MAQNIYDQEDFFKAYAQLPRSVHGLEKAPEFQVLRSWLPSLEGLSFLDLGCGFGWMCRWARGNGAKFVQGTDVSENMLARAREYPEDPSISYCKADLETLQISSNEFHVAYSSLALHYIENLPSLVEQVYKSLKTGGVFIFSVEHPIWTAPRNPDWIKDAEGRDVWPLDGYLFEGPRTTDWLAKGVVKQHRSIATYITILLDVGFILSAIDEWGPTPEQIKEYPDWARARHRPPFLLVKATKLAN
ncbi:hypothetical protein BOTCAL_0087g00090 [Botryotinia calthae]|uniref:Methyltransferase type 11 domain-containing protein n=1 Tax=Botryotinia calthae TaxID=38488 RepID=A0A4Y8D9V0_9HELO|nr:hypothetical protein BOTCAL_0087g00090 [Botryotinia calthae]